MEVEEQFLNSMGQILEIKEKTDEFIVGEYETEINSPDFNERLVKTIAELGYQFCIADSLDHDNPKMKGNLRFQYSQGTLPIDYFGSPFKSYSYQHYTCGNGPQLAKKDNPPNMNDHPSMKKKRFRLYNTKKFDCTAKLVIHTILFYPEYKVTSSCINWRRKKEVLQQLKTALEEGTSVLCKKKYFVRISLPNIHNHSIQTSLLNQSVHKSIITEIERLVDQGFTSIRIISSMLEDFTRRTADVCSPYSRAFHPDSKTVRNYVLRRIFTKKKTSIDQIALENRIEEWKSIHPEHNFYFRPFAEENDVVTPLLFVYQSAWQRKMMEEFGSLGLLDATYKTMRYSLPLFFLVVKTNVNYVPVASFIIQSEDTEAITEALNVIKEWNPNWRPEYFLTDCAEAEINAIEAVFSVPTFICDFHREQDWERWTKKTDNLDYPTDREELLRLFRNLAKSLSEEEFQIKLEFMENTDAWKRNKKFQNYVFNFWYPRRHKWVVAFFNENYQIKVTTNNGVESQNRLFKSTAFLKDSTDVSLTGTVALIVEKFVPYAEKNYLSINSKLDANYKKINENIPAFLRERPTPFVKHVYARYCTALSVYDSKMIVQKENGHFLVRSEENADEFHGINFNIPTCTCSDFIKHRLPCKHLCAIFVYVPGFAYENLPQDYKNNPFFSKNENVSIFSSNTTVLENENVTDICEETVRPVLADSTNHQDTSTSPNEEKKMICNLREICRNIIDLTYNLKPGQNENLEAQRQSLMDIQKEIAFSCSKSTEGIILRPKVNVNESSKKNKKYRELPPRKKKKLNKKDNVPPSVNLFSDTMNSNLEFETGCPDLEII